jgi:hypothetical protein
LICKPSTSRIREFAPCCIKAAESITGVRSCEDLVRFVGIDLAHMLYPRPGLSCRSNLIWCRTCGSFPTTAKDGVAPREQTFLQDCMHAAIAIRSVRSCSGRSSFRSGSDRRQCFAGASRGTGCNEHSDGAEHHQTAREPKDGWERNGFTAVANVLTSMGFALVLGSIYALRNHVVTWHEGLNASARLRTGGVLSPFYSEVRASI